MATGDEVIAALGELRESIGLAHTARRDLREAIKDTKRLLPEAVEKAAREYVQLIAAEARDEMVREVRAVIDQLAVDWREKLGLPAG